MMRSLMLSTAITLCLGQYVSAQTQDETLRNAEAFAPENAIVDTSIPFAIGAREARQELRGAFGWPTFQEGLVEGVYFRFDPDGYARFAPSPRLDTDVFEVICRPGTLNCQGRKGLLSIYLNGNGALQLDIAEVGDGDTMFLIEGASELQLPKRILGPLDERMELLLGSGGELLIKRGELKVARISLAGFSAVAAYLRWITARQDYGVLPRGWAVPNSSAPQGDPIAVNWQVSPAGQQNQPIFERQEKPANNPIASPATQQGSNEVLLNINELRDLLSASNDEAQPKSRLEIQPQSTVVREQSFADSDQTQISALQDTARALLEAAETLQKDTVRTDENMAFQNHQSGESPKRLANQLDYLMTEFGLDAKTALALIEREHDSELLQDNEAKLRIAPSSGNIEPSGDIVLDILAELRGQPSGPNLREESDDGFSRDEYQLLSDYFKSVFSGD